jgi:hypothetical protein
MLEARPAIIHLFMVHGGSMTLELYGEILMQDAPRPLRFNANRLPD